MRGRSAEEAWRAGVTVRHPPRDDAWASLARSGTPREQRPSPLLRGRQEGVLDGGSRRVRGGERERGAGGPFPPPNATLRRRLFAWRERTEEGGRGTSGDEQRRRLGRSRVIFSMSLGSDAGSEGCVCYACGVGSEAAKGEDGLHEHLEALTEPLT